MIGQFKVMENEFAGEVSVRACVHAWGRKWERISEWVKIWLGLMRIEIFPRFRLLSTTALLNMRRWCDDADGDSEEVDGWFDEVDNWSDDTGRITILVIGRPNFVIAALKVTTLQIRQPQNKEP